VGAVHGIQAKLAIGAVNDPLEHEADSVVNQVMQTPDPDLSVRASSPLISHACDACEEETLQAGDATWPFYTSGGYLAEYIPDSKPCPNFVWG